MSFFVLVVYKDCMSLGFSLSTKIVKNFFTDIVSIVISLAWNCLQANTIAQKLSELTSASVVQFLIYFWDPIMAFTISTNTSRI
jgi:hypothetical protein